MTDLLFPLPDEPEQLVGLRQGISILVNDTLGGLRGVFREIITIDGKIRYQVTVTDPGETNWEPGAPVSDLAQNWRV